MKHRWTTLLWELWAAQALCAVAALPPGSAFHTCPALALPGLALAAAVPTAWAAWALLAEPPDGLPPEQLLEHINAGAKAYKSYTEQELIELPPDVIWQKFFLKDFDIPAEKLAGLGEELCYMFDRYRKHIVKREGLKETLEALRQRGYRLGVISNIMSTTFVPRILEEHGIAQYFETITMSSVCGIRKPRPEIFEIALNEMRIGKEQAAYVGDTISRDVRGVRNAGWPLMIQIDNPRIYHKDEKYRGMGYEPDVKIGSLPEVVTAVEQYNRNLKEGQN